MLLSDFIYLRPTHIEQKLKDTNISILPLYIIHRLQASKIPILKTYDIDNLKGWFWASKFTSTITGISFNVTDENNLSETENILIEIILDLIDKKFDIPFFVEAEIELKKLDKDAESFFYMLLQSYFSAFNLRIDITDLEKQMEALNSFYKAIKNLELGLTLSLDNEDEEILDNFDIFLEKLSLFKIKPDYLYLKTNNYDLKNLVKSKIDVKLAENIEKFNNFSSNIYINGDFLKSGIKEKPENQVFYSAISLFKALRMQNSVAKTIQNLYRFGDDL